MKITLDWLRDHLDTRATVAEVTAALNRIGHEVEAVEDPAARLAGFRIARVVTAERHPQADKLQILSVDVGDEAPLQVVCGAPNARAGMIGVLGLPGAIVPASGMELKISAIRGVTSNGMMCSTRELELGNDHDGIIELPGDAPVGAHFSAYANVGEPVIDIAITPNRQDCMGVRGLAHDLAAAGVGALKPLVVPDIPGSTPCAVAIATDDPDGCPAFHGRTIHGVANGASPEWMQRRLIAVGQKPISALVDITNYVMLDLGRPSHAYDLATLTGPVVARRANPGEIVSALNGRDYALTNAMTVIADANGAHDIAGIMGGIQSGCSATTTDVLLEIAYFTPERIALTGQALALTSDARSRFERGVDPAFLNDAVAIITGHILGICGGTPSTVVAAGAAPVAARTLAYDPALCAALGGIDVPIDRQLAILSALGFAIDNRAGGEDSNAPPLANATPHVGAETVMVGVPSWRRDIDGPADLVEEITRIVGFDHIPSTPLPRDAGVARPTATPFQLTERKMRRAAAVAGFHEAVTWSFITERDARHFGETGWSLANPISDDMRVMRPSLLPGLLRAAARNQARGAASIRLFELGRRYRQDGERPTLAIVMAGDREPRGWQSGKVMAFDPFDPKRAVLAVLDAAGAPIDRLLVMPINDSAGGGDGGGDGVGGGDGIWHPGQSASLRLGPKTMLAEFGALHPSLAKAFDVAGPVMAAQLFLDALPGKRSGGSAVREAFAPPALQSVTRDFAFLVPDTVAAGDLVRAIRGADKANIVGARVFDRFVGAGVPEGHVSLAVEVTLQPVGKSYNEAALVEIQHKVFEAGERIGALMRTTAVASGTIAVSGSPTGTVAR